MSKKTNENFDPGNESFWGSPQQNLNTGSSKKPLAGSGCAVIILTAIAITVVTCITIILAI
jgi:hypothetical protein